MPDVMLSLSERECLEIAALARSGDGAACLPSVEEMATALLRAHLTLIRDCGDILPAGVKRPLSGAARITGKNGVSLSGGVHVNR